MLLVLMMEVLFNNSVILLEPRRKKKNKRNSKEFIFNLFCLHSIGITELQHSLGFCRREASAEESNQLEGCLFDLKLVYLEYSAFNDIRILVYFILQLNFINSISRQNFSKASEKKMNNNEIKRAEYYST